MKRSRELVGGRNAEISKSRGSGEKFMDKCKGDRVARQGRGITKMRSPLQEARKLQTRQVQGMRERLSELGSYRK